MKGDIIRELTTNPADAKTTIRRILLLNRMSPTKPSYEKLIGEINQLFTDYTSPELWIALDILRTEVQLMIYGDDLHKRNNDNKHD